MVKIFRVPQRLISSDSEDEMPLPKRLASTPKENLPVPPTRIGHFSSKDDDDASTSQDKTPKRSRVQVHSLSQPDLSSDTPKRPRIDEGKLFSKVTPRKDCYVKGLIG